MVRKAKSDENKYILPEPVGYAVVVLTYVVVLSGVLASVVFSPPGVVVVLEDAVVDSGWPVVCRLVVGGSLVVVCLVVVGGGNVVVSSVPKQ